MNFKLFFLIITVFSFYSCASNFYQVPVAQGNIISKSMISKLETGLSKAQVQYIMGTPSIIDPFDSNRWDYIGFQIVGSNTSSEVHHTLIFERDKLVSWIKKKGKSANEDLENETRKLNK